jgi:glutaredoxin
LSDFYPHGRIAECYGVLRKDGRTERALFVVDKHGIIRYVDVHDISEPPDNEVLFAELAKLAPQGSTRVAVSVRTAAPAPVPQLEPAPAPNGEITLYCTSWCPDCRRARSYLQEQGIAFAEVDISKDRPAAQRVRGWANGNETTPTFDIRGQILVGYDKAKLERLLQTVLM